MTYLEKAQYLTKGAENAFAAGDPEASLELALVAAQMLQLARLLEKKNESHRINQERPISSPDA